MHRTACHLHAALCMPHPPPPLVRDVKRHSELFLAEALFAGVRRVRQRGPGLCRGTDTLQPPLLPATATSSAQWGRGQSLPSSFSPIRSCRIIILFCCRHMATQTQSGGQCPCTLHRLGLQRQTSPSPVLQGSPRWLLMLVLVLVFACAVGRRCLCLWMLVFVL
jgi:hypothetical protein